IKNVEVDHIVKVRDVPALLFELVDHSRQHREKSAMAKQEPTVSSPALHSWGSDAPPLNGAPSVFTCPECGGTLWELHEGNGKVLRFRCHTGHSYSTESLLLEQDDKLERALWNAVRVMQEKAVLRRHLAHRVEKQGMKMVAASYLEQAKAAEASAATIRRLLDKGSAQLPSLPKAEAKHSGKKTKKRAKRKRGES